MAHNANKVLLSAGSATTAGTAVQRGRYQLTAYGTWDGATATLQWSYDNATWINVDTLASFTANGAVGVFLGDGYVRVNISGAGTTSLTVVLSSLE